MIKGAFFISLVCSLTVLAQHGRAQEQLVDASWYHLRNSGGLEWTEFADSAQNNSLKVTFPATADHAEKALSLRQYDVKLNWRVLLNGRDLGGLVTDEKDLIAYFPVPPDVLRNENTLEISTSDKQADDIKVGDIRLYQSTVDQVLSQAHITLEIVDSDTREHLPSRITVVNGMGILQSASADSVAPFALRPGYVYTSVGNIRLGLPAGTYTFYATRGFEYGVDSVQVTLKPGEDASHTFAIRREVSTTGWVSSDTHIHTFTWSRHGDASSADRVLTIAGEGIELPIITDHNLHADLKPLAIHANVQKYFTLIMGNEVTTRVGHFNVFPVNGKTVIDHKAENWKLLARNIRVSHPNAIILNHARDIHLGFRPFDPSRHLASAGMRLDGWSLPANAMEIMNSGSQQTDQMQLTRDWFGMLNRGHFITAVGASDSHDVSRFIVGQARTYIRCNDDDPANIDVSEAVKNFVDGSTMVSFGLLTEIEINDAYGPGELAPASDAVKVSVKVSGPAWARARKVTLYANGKKIGEETIQDPRAAGLKWSGDWNITMPTQDIFLVAVAEGPGVYLPFWPIAKPFQPVSPDWNPSIFGISGAVWLDGDRNHRRNSARDYATALYSRARNDVSALLRSLSTYDESVSIQAAALLHQKGKNLNGTEITNALKKATPQTQAAFKAVIEEVKQAAK
jgi:hypothetical protein